MVDADRSFLQVHVVPGEPERLALAQAEGERQRPPGTVAPSSGGFQKPLDLRHVVRLDVVGLQLRCLGQQHWVASQVGPPDCLIQCGPERAMDVVNAAWRQPIELELGVQPLHVVWRQPFQAVCTEAGDQVLVHVDQVAVVGVLGDMRRECRTGDD